MRTSFLVVLLSMASAANAQTFYKCVAKGKPTSFQSEPCPAGTKTARAVAATADVYRPAPVYQPPVRQPATNINNVVYNNSNAQFDERAQRRSNCQAAKNNRENTLNRVGLSRTYNLLQQLDANVNNACKGV